MVRVHEPAGDDAYDALMPEWVHEDDGSLLFIDGVLCLYFYFCLLDDLFFSCSALVVFMGEKFCDFFCLGLVCASE